MSILLPAALCAAAGTLWAGSGNPALLIPVTLTLAIPISLSALSGRVERYALVVLAAGCGFVLGAGAVRATDAMRPARLPVRESEIVAVQGRVQRATEHGEAIAVSIRLTGASGVWIRGDASGDARIIAASGPLPDSGDTITVVVSPGSVWRDDQSSLWMRADALSTVADAERGLGSVTAAVREGLRLSAIRVAGRAAPLVTALLLGETDELDPRVEMLFRRSGAIHLLALSGMHLAVIALFVRALVRPLAGPRIAALGALLAAVCYIAVVGPRPGLVRAALLVAVAIVMGAIDRRRPLVELLALCFLVQLIVQPGVATSLGFRLSYLSLVGIALVAPPIVKRARGWIPPVLAAPLSAGAGAQLFTTPLLLSQFGVWYPIGLLASLLLSPLVMTMMSVGLVAVLLDLVGFAAIDVLSRPILESLYHGVEWTSWVLSGFPGVTPATSRSAVIIASSALVCAGVWGLVKLYGRHDDVRGA